MSSRELVETASFDGEKVSGFLYRPDPAKFPGRRPLIVNIHGGPEGQSRPGFLGRNNYLLNELGVAIFYPNVRGSTGFGKRFVALDNGPDQRENSVKDIGAFLDLLARRSGARPGPHRPSPAAAMAAICATPRAILLRRPLQGRQLHRRHLQLRHLPREHPKLSPRPEAGRIWRRARSGAARASCSTISPLTPDQRDRACRCMV